MYPASKRMNWLSLTVNDYVGRCNFAIGKFTSLVHQLQKNIDDAEERLRDIETADLFRLPQYNASSLPDVTIFFDQIAKLRAADIKTVVRKYNDIGPILTKVTWLLRLYTVYSVSQKIPLKFSDIFPKRLGIFLVQILHAYCTFLSTLDYKFLFNYLQL